MIRNHDPSIFESSRYGAVGFDSGTVLAPGEQRRIITRPQKPFRGERLAIPASIAPYFQVLGLVVGYNHQMAGMEPLPAEVFASPREAKEFEVLDSVRLEPGLMRGERFELDPVFPGYDFVIEVVNISPAPYRFLAGVFGRIAR